MSGHGAALGRPAVHWSPEGEIVSAGAEPGAQIRMAPVAYAILGPQRDAASG